MNQGTCIAYATKSDPFHFKLGRVAFEPNVSKDYLPIVRERTVPRDPLIHLLFTNDYHILRLKPQNTTNWIDEGAWVIVMTNGYWRIGQVDTDHVGITDYVIVIFANNKSNLVRFKDIYEIDEMQLPAPYDKLFPQGGRDE